VGTLTVALYGISGKVAFGREPRLLEMSVWEGAIPLLPWTVWIYSSVYFIYLASCALQRDEKQYRQFLSGYVFAYALSGIFFVLYPTTFPREQFPLSLEAPSFTEYFFLWFRTIDLPTNCLPSMHVGSCVMSTLPFYKRRPRVFILFSIWSIAIVATTLTTKQHYFVDLIAGAGFGAFTHLLFSRFIPSRYFTI